MKINEARSLLNDTYIDWSRSHALANPHYIQKDAQITWENYIPGMLKLPIMASNVINLADTQQYTFQVPVDGSLIQIQYQYDPKGYELQSARLAFYTMASYEEEKLIESFSGSQREAPLIDITDRDIESEELFDEALDQNQLAPLIDNPINWLRIDYDPQHTKGVLHHDCHMHLSAFPDSRLIVAGVPTPRQFIEFIMALCYPKIYEKHRLDSSGRYTNEKYIMMINSNCVPLREHNVFRQMAHLRIPIISEGRGK